MALLGTIIGCYTRGKKYIPKCFPYFLVQSSLEIPQLLFLKQFLKQSNMFISEKVLVQVTEK